MDVPRLAVIGGSAVLAVILVVLVIADTGPAVARPVFVVWTVITFLAVAAILALRPQV